MGSNFIHHILTSARGVRVVNLDLLTYAGTVENVRGLSSQQYRFVRGDLCNTKLLARLMRDVDYVVNFAAETHVDRSIHGDDGAFVQTNIVGVHSLLRALSLSPRVRMCIHISTDEVWGDLPLTSRSAYTEASPFRPNSPYAASKAAGDLLVRSYVETFNLPIIVTHATNNFGPRQFPEKMIPFFITRALKGVPLPLYGDGRHRRDWLHVDDHSRAISLLLEKGEAGGVYAISRQGKEYSNMDVAKRILAHTHKPLSLITHVADRPGHDRQYRVNSAKLRSLGWEPKISLEEGLHATITWYTEHAEWVRATERRAKRLNPHIQI